MGQPPLTDQEHKFGEKLGGLLEGLSSIQEDAQALRAAGGDPKRAFMSVIPDEDKPAVEAQWPYISLLLGA